MIQKQSFLKSTIVLISAGLITRLLGFINRIIMARLIGEEGIGLYNMAIPTLFLMYTLSQVGLPIAVSKRVAEADARGDKQKVKKILVVALIITGGLSLLFAGLMILITPFITQYLLTDTRIFYPMLVMTPLIPITGCTAVLRGYFQGLQNMNPQSYAQVIEQIVRIATVSLFVYLLMPYGLEYAVVGALLSVVAGEIMSLLFLLSYFKTNKNGVRNRFFLTLINFHQTARSLFSIAIPSTGSRLISSLSNFLEPIFVAQSLAFAGFSTIMATKQYGLLTGYAMPLLMFPTFITHALGTAIIPNISEAEARSMHQTTHYRINQVIRISFASGAIASVIFLLFSDPILNLIYDTTQASYLIKFLAPFTLFIYVQFPLNATLQALDYAKVAMWNTLISTVVKFALLIYLTSSDVLGIFGTAIAMAVTFILTTLLHYASLNKLIGFKLKFHTILKMIGLLLATYITGRGLILWIPHYESNQMHFLLLLAILVTCYIIYLFLFKMITFDELKPIFKKR